MASDIEIRRLANDDEARMCAQVMAASEPWITLGRSYQDSLKTISDPVKEVYLARIDNQFCGFLIINMQGAFVGYIQTVCIKEGWRARGIGSRLLAFAEERIFADAPNVFLCVSSFNQAAQKLYLRLGYEIVGELKNYIKLGYAEILMRKTIAPLSEFYR